MGDEIDFPRVGQVFRITRITTLIKTGETRSETVYGITSLTPKKASPQRLLSLNRGHWSIENRSHWVRDMAFDEDRIQIRKGHGPHVMAALRNFAISFLRLATKVRNIARAFLLRFGVNAFRGSPGGATERSQGAQAPGMRKEG